MTSIIKFQALSGARDESPHCYLLIVDEFKFLLDCGWDENFNLATIKELKKLVNQIDAVLLSFPDNLHLGALPYMVGKCGLTCPIFSTIPVYKMGQMFMYDLYQSRNNSEDFELFTLDDVDAAFDKIFQLKYNQTVRMKGKGHGISITPMAAGHMIGGTIWRIVKDGEEDIVYAVDYNHKKERHLNGCSIESTITRPSLLIHDAYSASKTQVRRRLRDEQLMTNILKTLRNNGNVLVAVDTAGRVLELAHMVDQLWRNQDSGLQAYSLSLLNNVSYNVVEFAKSQVEWMSDKIMRSFEGARNNPFQFKHLQLCHSMAELNRIPDPKVVLASTPDLECGFSRDLFIQWCSNSKNSVILTSKTAPGTLARQLIDNPNMKSISLTVKKRVRLEGLELEIHMKKERAKEQEAARIRAEKENDIDTDSSDESEEDIDDKSYLTGKIKNDLMISNEGKIRNSFFKQAKKAYPIYPVKEEKLKWDDYGEIIKAEDFMITETNLVEDEKKINDIENDINIQDITEVPTKCIVTTQTLDINACIQYIDFEGRSDVDSVKKIISKIKPRSLIVVRGVSDEITNTLVKEIDSLATSIVEDKIFAPVLHEIVDATTESHIYQVRLRDSVVSSLKFSKAKDVELAWMDGVIMMPRHESLLGVEANDSDDVETKMDVETEFETAQIIPTLELLSKIQAPSHSTVFINELKLSDFKQVLLKAGIHAEFSGGILYCNNVVAVRRSDAGRIHMEGCFCEDYYRVQHVSILFVGLFFVKREKKKSEIYIIINLTLTIFIFISLHNDSKKVSYYYKVVLGTDSPISVYNTGETCNLCFTIREVWPGVKKKKNVKCLYIVYDSHLVEKQTIDTDHQSLLQQALFVKHNLGYVNSSSLLGFLTF
ncbi:Cleavage and polyadenylation specificity factor subunit 2 [Nymphon striatum]|nr:Cleavage and polyadenylation specificity factor subunit 2 [Nymphon striatum]